MPINNFLLPGAKFIPAFNVDNSCRFNDDDSAYMHKTPGSAGNRAKWTYSAWIKLGRASGAQRILLNGYSASTDESRIFISSGQRLGTYNWVSNSADGNYETSRLLRDPSAWYHVVVSWDSDNATAGDRIKMYINGTEETSFNTESNPGSGSDSFITSNVKHWMGASPDGQYFDGYMAEVCLCDGQTYAASDFGEFDEDSPTIWKPKDVSGLTFGTNGFYLDFEDSSNLGNDANGGTDFTEVNLAAVDQATDTPTNNFATLNPLNVPTSTAPVFSEGNCQVVSQNASSKYFGATSTLGMTAGKWYAEFVAVSVSNGGMFGANGSPGEQARNNGQVGYTTSGYGYHNGGDKKTDDSGSSYGDTFTDGDIIGVALDLDNLKIYFAKNGTWQDSGDPTSGATGTGAAFTVTAVASTPEAHYVFSVSDNATGSTTLQANFGGCPAFSISSGNADGDGYGNFEYAVPSGYYALCTKNLAEYG